MGVLEVIILVVVVVLAIAVFIWRPRSRIGDSSEDVSRHWWGG
jgi:hypothetical protein